MKLCLTILLLVAELGVAQEHWVATWTTAQLLVRPNLAPPAAAAAQPSAAPKKAGGPGAPNFTNQTVRMMVRTSIGGRRLRVKLANAFGSAPVVVGAAHIAIRKAE